MFFRTIRISTLIIIAAAAAVLIATGSRLSQAVNARPAGLDFVVPKESVSVPIIMYHSVLWDPERTGPYIVTPVQLEADLKYLKDAGFEAVFISELIEYVLSGFPLPNHPVVITFDDAYLNNTEYVIPLLQKYETKATLSVVGAYCDFYSNVPDRHLSYAHMTWSDLRAAVKSGLIEIGNHSYDMHSIKPRRGTGRREGESLADYERAFSDDTKKMQSRLMDELGIDCVIYTYPLGHISDESEPLIKSMGFLASLSCYERGNILKAGDAQCLYKLGRYNRSGKDSTEDFMKKVGISPQSE